MQFKRTVSAMASAVSNTPQADAPPPSLATGGGDAKPRVSGFAHDVLLEPTMLENGLEVSVHTLPRMVKRELKMVLMDQKLDGMLAVLTAQHAAMDLVATGPDVADEKDSLLETVRRSAFPAGTIKRYRFTHLAVCWLGQAFM